MESTILAEVKEPSSVNPEPAMISLLWQTVTVYLGNMQVITGSSIMNLSLLRFSQ